MPISRSADADRIELVADNAKATIARSGAEPVAWRVGKRQLLWTSDPTIWDRTSPILFPIVGRAREGFLRVAGQTYPMEIHGFAAGQPFRVVESGPNFAVLALSDNDATRAQFPFRFRLEVRFDLAPSRLALSFSVSNPGETPLPYALGFHPGFAWPFSADVREGHSIEFEQAEAPEVPVITSAGLFSPEQRAVALAERRLSVTDELMRHEALCFLNVRSRSLRFCAPDGTAIQMEVDDFPHFALWSRPGAPFLCMEAWTSHGDPDGFAGDIFEKPFMRSLAPGAEAKHAVRLEFLSQI